MSQTAAFYSVSKKLYGQKTEISVLQNLGLHPLVYENMPNLSLVSNGAECVLISKQFLQDHLDKTTAHRLKMKMPMYPNLGEFQTALDDQVAWDSYRGKVIHDVLK